MTYTFEPQPECQSEATPTFDGLPELDPLCDLQASIAQAYAGVLTHLAQQHVVSKASGDAKSLGQGILLERLQADALWAVSEVRKSTPFKLRRQRFISQDVFDRWRNLMADPPKRQDEYDRGADNETLKHEHVVQRKGLGTKLKSQTELAGLTELLMSSTSCVVSCTEDRRLRAVAKADKLVDGWDRYRMANPPVGVYDRKEKLWLIPRS